MKSFCSPVNGNGSNFRQENIIHRFFLPFTRMVIFNSPKQLLLCVVYITFTKAQIYIQTNQQPLPLLFVHIQQTTKALPIFLTHLWFSPSRNVFLIFFSCELPTMSEQPSSSTPYNQAGRAAVVIATLYLDLTSMDFFLCSPQRSRLLPSHYFHYKKFTASLTIHTIYTLHKARGKHIECDTRCTHIHIAKSATVAPPCGGV